MKAQGLLFQVQDKGYRDFQSKLIPTIPAETIIGVRTPGYTEASKRICQGSGECSVFDATAAYLLR